MQRKKLVCLFAVEAKWPGIGLQNQDLSVQIRPTAPFYFGRLAEWRLRAPVERVPQG